MSGGVNAKAIYCGNNELSPELRANGGARDFGSYSECIKKGYARGFNQQIPDLVVFLRRWSGKYKPHVLQRLYYGDGEDAPPGYQRATLAQAAQRGYALGALARAKKEQKKASDKASSRGGNARPVRVGETAGSGTAARGARLPARF